MNRYFIFFAVIAAALAIALFIVNKIKKSQLLGNICFICVVIVGLMVGCVALEVEKLFEKEVSTDYHPVTTYASTTQRNNGRPVKNRTTTPTTSPSTGNHADTNIVYITRNGKKYHLSYTCGGNEYYECTLTQALDRGLEPCKRCAQ